jgi:hypothetical protein
MSEGMESVWLATRTQIGQDVLLTGRAPQVVSLAWDQELFPSLAGRKSQLL